MAILRDALRLGFFEPLARWKLYRDLRRKREARLATSKFANGFANGNGNANGHANGHTNGHTNGHANGHANGHGNGNGNGHANGYANGHSSTSTSWTPTRRETRLIERSVMRFAEQGWNVVYYPLQWAFGMVRFCIPHPCPNLSTNSYSFFFFWKYSTCMRICQPRFSSLRTYGGGTLTYHWRPQLSYTTCLKLPFTVIRFLSSTLRLAGKITGK